MSAFQIMTIELRPYLALNYAITMCQNDNMLYIRVEQEVE